MCRVESVGAASDPSGIAGTRFYRSGRWRLSSTAHFSGARDHASVILAPRGRHLSTFSQSAVLGGTAGARSAQRLRQRRFRSSETPDWRHSGKGS